VCGCIDVLAICDKCIDFVHNIWEGSIDWCEVAVNYVVVADCSGYGVIVEFCASVV